MSNNNYPRRLLDDAIDRAVHELVKADPRPGFRRRVMAKVNAPARRSSWPVRYLVPAAAMAAMLLLAAWLIPDAQPVLAPSGTQVAEQRETPAPSQTPAVATPAAAPLAPSERSESSGPAPSERSESSGRRTPPRRDQPVQFTFGPPSGQVAATSLDRAVEPAPLATERHDEPAPEGPAALPMVRIRPIEVQPILIKPIELKPIGGGSSQTPQ